MKINQIIINELSEGAQPGVATTTAQTPQAQAAAQAIQKGLEKLQQQSPGLDHSFNTTTAIQEILPDGTVVMDSNLQPSALQNVRKILALGGGANFKVSMSYQGIPSAANMSTVPPAQPQPGVAEGDVPFRGVGGAFNRGDNERHDLDPTDWYIVKDGEMFSASIYPRQVQQAISQGFSRTRDEAHRAEAQSRADSQGVAEGQQDDPEDYRAHLIKTLPAMMNYFAKTGKGWSPGEQEMLGAIDTAYMVMKHTGDVKQAGKAMMDELNTLHRMSQGQQGVAEGSEWETRHDEFTTVGDRATPEQINKIVKALIGAAQQAGSKRGFLNQLVGKQSNGDLARMAHVAETLAKNIQKNSNAKPGSDERKELGQHLVYAVSLLKRISGEQGVAEAGNANSGRRGPNFQDNSPAIPGRVEPLPQGLKHHADASRYGGTEPNVEDDRLLGPASRHRLHQAVTPDDWFDESQEKIAGRHDPDDFDNMVGRLKQLAGAGPLKTVWDPEKRVYRNVPHAVQPPQQPKKATQ